ncbi:MAG TPA: hypothetical protein VGD89_03275, partial [Flavipsychrobacter sp.]
MFISKQASACHFGAADMYVTYVGNAPDGCGVPEYKYEVTLIIYYACQTCPTDGGTGGVTINYKSDQAGVNTTLLLNPDKANADTLHSLCPVYYPKNSCIDISKRDSFPAFQARAYVAQVTLPSAQPDWTFWYSSCCRNDANLVGGSGNSFYIEAGLNNQIKYNNSTPRITSNPLPYLCVGQPTGYLTEPFDFNGDSLNVSQQYPMSGPAAYLTYKPGFSLADPIGSSAANPYTLNPLTGTATFTPMSQGFMVLDFRVDEYDRNTKIRTGYTTRDVQVSVLPCTAPPPGLDSLSQTLTVDNGAVVPIKGGGKSIVTCPGNTLNFSLNSQTGDPTHNVYMTANLDKFPGATFNVAGAGTNNVTGTFTWVPTTANIGEHTLVITSSDSTCNLDQPIVLRNKTVILITVVSGLDAGRDLATCKINPPGRQLSVRGYGSALLNIKWRDISGGPAKDLNADDIPDPISTARTNTEYVVSSTDLKDKCKASDTVLVYVDTTNTIDVFPQTDRFVMCRPGYLQLDAVISGPGPISNLACGTTSITACTTYDSLVVWGSPNFGTGIAYDTVGTASPRLPGDMHSSKYQFLIRKDELKEYGLRSSIIRALSFETSGNGDPTLEYANFTIALGCTDKNVVNKAEGFETSTTQVFKAPANITFVDGKHKFIFDEAYTWDTSKNLLVEFCYSENPVLTGPCTPTTGIPPVISFMPTTYPSGLIYKAQNTTTQSVCGTKNAAAIIEYTTRPVFQFDYCEAPGLPFLYMWTPGNYLSDSTIKEPLAYVPQTTNYAIRTNGRNGCIIADTLQVYVPEHDFSVYPKDTAICFGESFKLEVRKGTYYQWYEYENGEYKPAIGSVSCDMCADPMVSPKKNTHYKIMVGDDVFCYDTIDAYVEVRPLPLVNILTPDTTIKYGQSVQLLVNGARLYNWSPVSSLNNPNISYPVATPTESTMYVVTGLGTN